MPKKPTTAIVNGWTDPNSVIINWFYRCGRCGKRRIRAQYVEMYAPGRWWPECLKCAVATLGDKADEYLAASRGDAAESEGESDA